MNQKDRFELEASILLAAYAYAVQGYAAPAAVLGILAAVLAVESHSGNLLMKLYPEIVLLSAVQLTAVRWNGLDQIMPSLGILSFCNAVFAVLWMQSSDKALKAVMKRMLSLSAAFYLGVLAMPEAVLTRLFAAGRFTTVQVLILVSLIYLPLDVCWGIRSLQNIRKKQCRCDTMKYKHRTGGSHDAVARTGIRSKLEENGR